MLKRLVSLCLVCFCVLSFCTPSSAMELAGNDSRYENFLTDFYDGKIEAYTIWDRNGNEVTEQFYLKTLSYAEQGQWDKIEQYCIENIKSLRHTQTHISKTRAQEMQKTEVQDQITYVDGVSGPNYKNFRTQVDFELKGTIWYNVDTGKITNAEARIGKVILQSGCRIASRQANAKVCSDERSAKMECSIYTEYILIYDELQMTNPVKFEPAKHSFTMYV